VNIQDDLFKEPKCSPLSFCQLKKSLYLGCVVYYTVKKDKLWQFTCRVHTVNIVETESWRLALKNMTIPITCRKSTKTNIEIIYPKHNASDWSTAPAFLNIGDYIPTCVGYICSCLFHLTFTRLHALAFSAKSLLKPDLCKRFIVLNDI
jgi:hypothetical protein